MYRFLIKRGMVIDFIRREHNNKLLSFQKFVSKVRINHRFNPTAEMFSFREDHTISLSNVNGPDNIATMDRIQTSWSVSQ